MANRTISVAGGNWTANTAWVEGSPPDATMDVIATVASGNITINSTAPVCKTMVLTGYVGTMTFTAGQRLNVSGNVTFVAGMTLTGTGTLRLDTGGTITSGGLTFPGDLTFNSANTWTLGDNWIVTGTVANATGATVLNSNTLRCNGSLATTQNCSGTTTLQMGGTGTISTSTSSITIANNLTFNSAGTITLGTNIAYLTGTILYTAGTIVNTGNTLTIKGTCTLNTSTMHWNNITWTLGGTVTMSSAVVLDGLLTITTTASVFSGAFDITTVNVTLGTSITFTGNVIASGNLIWSSTGTTVGAFNIQVAGNVTINNGVVASGTMTILMNGTGTVSCATSLGTYALSPGVIGCPFTVNTAGTITFGTIFGINASTVLTNTAGSFDFTTNNNLLYMAASINIPTAFAWNGLLFSQGTTRTYTMTQDWTFAGDIVVQLNSSTSATIAGSFNMSCRNLILYGANTLNFKSSQTLTVTTGLFMGGENVSQYTSSGATLQSTTSSTAFNLKYQGTIANNKVYGVTFTDVDASTSTRAIVNWNGGTLTRTTNINNVNLPVTLAATGVSS